MMASDPAASASDVEWFPVLRAGIALLNFGGRDESGHHDLQLDKWQPRKAFAAIDTRTSNRERPEGAIRVAGSGGSHSAAPVPAGGLWGLRPWLELFDQASSGARLDRRGFLIFQVVFWTASSLSLLILLATFYPSSMALAIVPGRILIGVVLSILLHRSYSGRTLLGVRGRSRFCWIIALNAGVAVISSAMVTGLVYLGLPELPSDAPFVSVLVARLISLLTWNTAYFGVLLVKEHHAARLDASDARLAARAGELAQLRSQINPHFLLNSLNSVVAERRDPGKVEALVLSLAGYLRFSLQQGPGLAPLGRELDALENYLQVEKIRFEEMLEYHVLADIAARAHEVPNALILPLLENAVKYGQLTSPPPLRLTISACIEAGEMVILVANSGRWMESGSSNGTGIGLANLRKRLELLYCGTARLEVSAGGSRVEVRVRFPADFHPLIL